MRTDHAPIDYAYLSSRLLRDLKEQDEAFRRPRRRRSFGLSFFGLSVNVEAPAIAQGGLRAIARRSADLVSDQTGTVDQPSYYVLDELDMWHGIFAPHMGWRGGSVAAYRSTVMTEHGLTTIALFGSASNVVGYRASTDGEGYCPSDIMGLYTLLDLVREPQDPEIDLNYRTDELGMTPAARAATAIHLAQGGATESLGRLGVLFRVLIDEDDVQLHTGTTSRVLLGTPLWIATPEPRPFTTKMRP